MYRPKVGHLSLFHTHCEGGDSPLLACIVACDNGNDTYNLAVFERDATYRSVKNAKLHQSDGTRPVHFYAEEVEDEEAKMDGQVREDGEEEQPSDRMRDFSESEL